MFSFELFLELVFGLMVRITNARAQTHTHHKLCCSIAQIYEIKNHQNRQPFVQQTNGNKVATEDENKSTKMYMNYIKIVSTLSMNCLLLWLPSSRPTFSGFIKKNSENHRMHHTRNIKKEIKNQNKRAISWTAVAQFPVNHTNTHKNILNQRKKKMKWNKNEDFDVQILLWKMKL